MQEKKQDVIEKTDRVSLIKFNSRLRKTFSLVKKNSNFAQLRNQIDILSNEVINSNKSAAQDHVKEKEHHLGYLASSLKALVHEFERHMVIKK